jgi:hypothetical protein
MTHPKTSFALLALLGGISMHCSGPGSPGTSSSTSWYTCEDFADCDGAPFAVACEGGYCVDSDGARIPRDSGAGGSGGTSPGGGASGSGSAQGTGGAAQTGGTQNLGGTGAGGSLGGAASTDATCTDISPLAQCSADEDCTVGTRTTDCCGAQAVVGVNLSKASAFAKLRASCDASYPACGCAALEWPTTDDGRLVMDGDVVGVACVEGTCQSHIASKKCGDALSCGEGEICLMVDTVTGPTQTQDYSCVPDPCSGELLDCGCAAALCEIGDGHARLCSTQSFGLGEVTCQDQAQ